MAALVVATLAVASAAPAFEERSVGVFDVLAAEAGVVVFLAGLVTQLGDPWFLLAVAGTLALADLGDVTGHDSRDGAFVLGVALAAFSFTDLLKNVLGAPRPPGAGTAVVPPWVPDALAGLFRSIATGTGYAFPSGHAIGTSAVFAALASTLAIGRPASRWGVAVTGIAAVAASRVVLGVHYLVDVVVGCLAGFGLLAVATAVGRRRPRRVFALGVVVGALAVAASAASAAGTVWSAAQWLGGSVGAALGWSLARPARLLPPRRAVLVGVPLAALWVGVYVTAPPLPVTLLGTALAAAGMVAAPRVLGPAGDGA